MITLLKRVFLRNDDEKSVYGRKKYGMLCSIVGIVLNLIMFGGKYAIGVISGSVAIVADAKNNLGDGMTNIAMLLGMCLAGIEGGKKHTGGHGRIEWLVSLVTGWMVFSLGMHQFSNSIRAIRDPGRTDFNAVIVALLVVSVLLKGYMWFYNKRIGKKIESLSMQAVATDCISDMISTIVVIISMTVEYFFNLRTDGWCGILVSVFIMYAGYQVLAETIMTILGKNADEDLRKKIEDVAVNYPSVSGVHEIMVHDYGVGKKYASFYIEGINDSNLRLLWNEADKIAKDLYRETGCECMVVVDIMNDDREKQEAMKVKLEALIKDYDKDMGLYDLRLADFDDHTNVIVKVSSSKGYGRKLEIVKGYLSDKITEMDKQYVPVVKVVNTHNEGHRKSR